ncbi:putative periplasmic lipoprotein [Flavobacterium terrigena]|uniref:Lipocalin-like domain-containing protein n=1 Tax=Flavobacterium terrigena TaxID=402734 RepID=A0A1H6QMG2_9FLAO|nr:hypothetical protein [Flavobacterium terrigena]SEI41347.1 hypothetical protein SAMN05660918_0427 [Flavobacterium terrigena]
MKKYLLLFVAALIFVSCGSDDEPVVAEASIIGSWEYYKEGTIVGGTETLANYENSCSTKKDYVEFLQNGEYDDVYYDSNCDESIDYGDWTKSGNMLTNVTEDTTVEILVLTNTTLKIKYVDTDGAIYTTVFRRK